VNLTFSGNISRLPCPKISLSKINNLAGCILESNLNLHHPQQKRKSYKSKILNHSTLVVMMLASLYLLAFAVLSSLFASCLCSEAFKVSQVSSLNRRPRGGPAGLVRAYARYGLPVSQSLATSDAAQLKGHIGSSSADPIDYEIM
jgi:hypothetical protein